MPEDQPEVERKTGFHQLGHFRRKFRPGPRFQDRKDAFRRNDSSPGKILTFLKTYFFAKVRQCFVKTVLPNIIIKPYF